MAKQSATKRQAPLFRMRLYSPEAAVFEINKLLKVSFINICFKYTIGGEGGIRTHGPLTGTPVFKTGAFNRSATSPRPVLALELSGLRGRAASSLGNHPVSDLSN